jgi:glycosyltransferase involved in cell wall biosynthesis
MRHHDGSGGSVSDVIELPVTVVICAYTMRRWDTIRAAIGSVLDQRPRPAQVLLVVDHNPDLALRARAELPEVEVLDSDEPQGLSGARNAGLKAAKQPVTAFLDDDAQPRPGWLASLVEPYEWGHIVATGGRVEPRWPRQRPYWLPREFDWVVGCSYVGLPAGGGYVRNPIGASMSMQTRLAIDVGGFDVTVGRVANRPAGCEETELSIRLTAARPGSAIYYAASSVVDHQVSADRVRFRYLIRRCWHEGLSKASVVQLSGASAGLQRERRQAAVVIPRSFLRESRELLRGHMSALPRMATTMSGLTMTICGYLTGRIRYKVRKR